MFVANRYVRLMGKLIAAGEIIPDGLPAEKIERLLNVGAIFAVAPRRPIESEPAEEIIDDIDATEGVVMEESVEKPTKKRAGRSKKK